MPARCSAAKVRAKMMEAGITAGKLSALTTLSPSTINRVLNDKAYHSNDYTLQRLADVLHCSPYDLLRDEIVEEAVREEAANTVADVVAEAVMEAVTVVTDEVAPDVDPERNASRIAELQQSRNTWRTVAIVAMGAFLLAVAYFGWEIFHPGSGLSAVLSTVYGTMQ